MEYNRDKMSRGGVSKARILLWALLPVALLITLCFPAFVYAAKDAQEMTADRALNRRLDGAPENPAEWYALGEKYFRGANGMKQDYGRALSYWMEPAAKNSYGPALYGIGVLYLNGLGVEKNAATAHHWFYRAAAQNYAPSFYRLGRLYDEGNGVARNPAAAAEWYRRGILFDDMDARYALGMHYYNGNGVRKSYSNAYRLWIVCAENGNKDAQFNIGALYESGKGVQKNSDLARQWYDKAAQQGHEGALKALEDMLSLEN